MVDAWLYHRATNFQEYKFHGLLYNYVYRTSKIIIIIYSQNHKTIFLLLPVCSSPKYFHKKVFKANFQQSLKFYILENMSPYSVVPAYITYTIDHWAH